MFRANLVRQWDWNTFGNFIFPIRRRACPVDSLTVNPQNRTVAVGATVNYTAVPAASNCNFIGACTDYVYNWSISGTPIPHSSIRDTVKHLQCISER